MKNMLDDAATHTKLPVTFSWAYSAPIGAACHEY